MITNQNIEVERVAIGVQAEGTSYAPCEYWYPSKDETELPDSDHLAMMLTKAIAKFGRTPGYVKLQIISKGRGYLQGVDYTDINGVQLEMMLEQVLDDCIEKQNSAAQS